MYIGAEKKGWIWIFPLAPDRVTAGVVMQNSYLRQCRAELPPDQGTDWKTQILHAELSSSPFAWDLLGTARQVHPTFVNGDYSYTVEHHHGSNYALIGDARGFIDPIFSSGVFLSMKTAYLVSGAVASQLADPSLAGRNAELDHAYELVNGAYELVHRMIRLFYDPHAVTWASIGGPDQIHKSHEAAMAAGHYMLAGDFFENHERYNKFFGLLESPRNFEHYKNYVIEREAFRESSCGIPREVAFGRRTDRLTPEQVRHVTTESRRDA